MGWDHPVGETQVARSAAPEGAAEPRFDQALPLRQRIQLYRYRDPATDKERELKARMLKASKGRDLDALAAEFCAWMQEAGNGSPRDAQKAFVGWLEKTTDSRRPP